MRNHQQVTERIPADEAVPSPSKPAAPDGELRLVAVVELPVEHLDAAQRYEDAVLTLLGRHDGQLERRLRTTDGRTEVHLLRFPSRAAFDAFLGDPERAALRASFGEAAPSGRILEVEDLQR